ncbi:MAG: hypothetical protein WDN04_03340 [Rhodospirillales bacterium]
MLRDEAGLATAAACLVPLAEAHGPASDPALLGLMMVAAMQLRRESRGGHARTDFADRSAALAFRRTLTWEQARAAVRVAPAKAVAPANAHVRPGARAPASA